MTLEEVLTEIGARMTALESENIELRDEIAAIRRTIHTTNGDFRMIESHEHTDAIDVATGRHQGVWVRLAPDGSGQWQVAVTAVHDGKHASLAAPCENADASSAQLHHALNAVAGWDGTTQAQLLGVFSHLIAAATGSLSQSLASLNAGAERVLRERGEH